MKKLSVEVVLEFDPFESCLIWEMFTKTHYDELCFYKKFTRDTRPIKLSKIYESLAKENLPHFSIEFNGSEFHYASGGAHNMSFVILKDVATNVEDAEKWLSIILSEKAFISARVYDHNFNYWQNANNPLQYKVEGKSLRGLKIYKDEDLNNKFIDTSRNPGRRILRVNFIEALGHVMWFGPRFWEVTGSSLESLQAEIDCSVTEVNDKNKIKFQEEPFTSAEGHEGRFQDELRRILFPKTYYLNSRWEPL